MNYRQGYASEKQYWLIKTLLGKKLLKRELDKNYLVIKGTEKKWRLNTNNKSWINGGVFKEEAQMIIPALQNDEYVIMDSYGISVKVGKNFFKNQLEETKDKKEVLKIANESELELE